MLCPICGKEMEKGGLIGAGVTLQWFPQTQFGKKGAEETALYRRKNDREIKRAFEPDQSAGCVLLQ